jgi:hypothetical protein
MVNTNVLVSGHPEAFVPVEIYVPLEVYVCPFTDQVYVSQDVCGVDSDELLLIVNNNVLVSGQPAALVPTKEYVPLEVYVCPFTDQVYVSHVVTD